MSLSSGEGHGLGAQGSGSGSSPPAHGSAEGDQRAPFPFFLPFPHTRFLHCDRRRGVSGRKTTAVKLGDEKGVVLKAKLS